MKTQPELVVEPSRMLDRRVRALSATKPVVVSTPSKFSTAEELRTERRAAAFRSARIILPDGSELPCILKDISASGARILLQGAAALPHVVTLVVDTSGRRVRADVRWKDDSEAGLQWVAA